MNKNKAHYLSEMMRLSFVLLLLITACHGRDENVAGGYCGFRYDSSALRVISLIHQPGTDTMYDVKFRHVGHDGSVDTTGEPIYYSTANFNRHIGISELRRYNIRPGATCIWIESQTISGGCGGGQEISLEAWKGANVADPKTSMEEEDQQLDSMFRAVRHLASFRIENTHSSLLIGHLFKKDERHAVLWRKVSDSSARLTVLKETGSLWDTLLAKIVEAPEFGAIDRHIEITDFNGDGVADLKVWTSYGELHSMEWYKLWLFQSGGLTEVQGFEKLVSPEFYKGDGRIYCYTSTGCADLNMFFGVYKIVDQKLETVSETSCDCCSEKGDSCIIHKEGGKVQSVPISVAHHYVPAYYAAAVKDKLKS